MAIDHETAKILTSLVRKALEKYTVTEFKETKPTAGHIAVVANFKECANCPITVTAYVKFVEVKDSKGHGTTIRHGSPADMMLMLEIAFGDLVSGRL